VANVDVRHFGGADKVLIRRAAEKGFPRTPTSRLAINTANHQIQRLAHSALATEMAGSLAITGSQGAPCWKKGYVSN